MTGNQSGDAEKGWSAERCLESFICTTNTKHQQGTLGFSLDRGPLAKIISFRGTHLGNTWFMLYLKDI